MATTNGQARPRLDVEYSTGIHLVDSILWFDAPRRVDLCFLSHAHLDRPVAHGKVLTTEPTARLAGAQLPAATALISPFHRRFSLGGLDLELYPAGHILGAAQLRVTRDQQSLVYTGHFDLEAGRTVVAASLLECDVLVLDAGDAAPGQRRIRRASEERALLAWIEEVRSHRGQAVVIAEALGAAQELASLFVEHGLRVRAHRSVYRHCRIYHQLGTKLPGVRQFRGTPARDEVTLFPLSLGRCRAVERIPKARTALVAAGANAKDLAARFRATRGFELSCSADHPAVARYARESGARLIYVVGRFAGPLAADLRAQGLLAWPLEPPEQMDLFGLAARGQLTDGKPPPSR